MRYIKSSNKNKYKNITPVLTRGQDNKEWGALVGWVHAPPPPWFSNYQESGTPPVHSNLYDLGQEIKIPFPIPRKLSLFVYCSKTYCNCSSEEYWLVHLRYHPADCRIHNRGHKHSRSRLSKRRNFYFSIRSSFMWTVDFG